MTDFIWTSEQAAAIQADGHTILAASAGTGKTTTVIGKILWHLGVDIGVNDAGEPIPPCPERRRVQLQQIAAITFTEKAAYDLKKKLRAQIAKYLPELVWEIDRASIGTIHSFCMDLLREHAFRLGVDPTFRVLDERETRLEQDEIIKDVVLRALGQSDEGAIDLVERYRLTGYEFTKDAVEYVRLMLRDMRWHAARYEEWVDGSGGALDIERLRRIAPSWSEPDDIAAGYCATLHRMAREADKRWRCFQEDENVRDFDSLILDTRALLSGTAASAALEGIRRRLSLLIIDEFQDTDAAQRDIAFAIAGVSDDSRATGATPPELFLVGDAKQSIYGFRGADISVWNEVTTELCGDDRPLQLTHNFRSDPEIVAFVNRVCEPVMEETGDAVAAAELGGRVGYAQLTPARESTAVAEVEWMAASGKAPDRRQAEAEMVAARIRDVVIDEDRGDVDGIQIPDPDNGQLRDCSYRDVAILFRTRTSLEFHTRALERYGVPYYLAGDAGLTKRQEIIDLLTVLRLIENPRDDLCAFGYLRSPFVGLRDEVITKMRLSTMRRTLLKQARMYLEDGEWYAAPEHQAIVQVEKTALAAGLDAIEKASALRSRVPIDELLEEVLDATGYRLHLFLMDQPAPRLANIERFIRLMQGYRNHTVGTFLEIWDRWEGQDLGIPQAPVYSKRDDVVTLSTIHAAKGLEWPIVFLVDSEGDIKDRSTNDFWSDRVYGPLIGPKAAERGERAALLQRRKHAEGVAEEARLTYVATTRARDRLIVTGPLGEQKGVATWLARGIDDSVTVTTQTPLVEIPQLPPEPTLDWFADVRYEHLEQPLVSEISEPPLRRTRSATELMARHRSFAEWKFKYRHGVIPNWYFAKQTKKDGPDVPQSIRGDVIHGVLELIQEEEELAELLDLAIGALDSPELEQRMGPGTDYRVSLEGEIRGVIGSEQWKWYVDGEHYRELSFVQLRTPGKWRVGAFDLFRPTANDNLIVDFKTHDIGPEEVEKTARKYVMQALMYKTVAEKLTGTTRMRLHFTRPNTMYEL